MAVQLFVTIPHLGIWSLSATALVAVALLVDEFVVDGQLLKWFRVSLAISSVVYVWLLFAYICDGAPWWWMPCW